VLKTQRIWVSFVRLAGIRHDSRLCHSQPVVCTLLVALAVGLALPSHVKSAELLYGDMMGNDVTFLAVREASDDPLPLYGAPNLVSPPSPTFPCVLADNCTVNGNSLTFSPQLFDAVSENQSPLSESTDGQLLFMAQAKPGQAIQNVHFQEGGAFTVSGIGATDDTRVDVSSIGFVTVNEVDGVGVDPIAIPIDMLFDFGAGGNGEWRFLSEGTANGQIWNGMDLINVSQALMDRGVSFDVGATKVTVNLDNTLFAQSEDVGTARIDKKLFFIVTVNVPEPASLSLVLAGAVVACFTRRRRVR
jgi:hypothetical protein